MSSTPVGEFFNPTVKKPNRPGLYLCRVKIHKPKEVFITIDMFWRKDWELPFEPIEGTTFEVKGWKENRLQHLKLRA